MEESNCGDEVETIITKRRKTDVDHELTKPSSKNVMLFYNDYIMHYLV